MTLTLSACGMLEDALDPDIPEARYEPEAFTPPSDAVQIGDTGLYLRGGSPAPALLSPSASSTAPKIVATTAVKTGAHSYSIYLDIESSSDIAFLYLDFGADGVFRARPQPESVSDVGTDAPITACGVAASSQGIVCTQACLQACSCLSCGSDSVETNAEQSCALNCTLYDRNGALDAAPYDGSEATFASLLYSGSSGVPGLASQLGCSASVCSKASANETATRRVRGWVLQFEAPEVPQATPMFAPQAVSADAVPQASPAAAPATVMMCDPGILPCRAQRS